MPTPVAHTLAGACAAILVGRLQPAARALPVVAAVLVAANLPDLDYLSVLRGRAAMERFHQGPLHSVGFIMAAAAPLALLVHRRLGLSQAWLLLAGAALTHLLLDLLVVDRKPPVGFAIFWPWSARRFHGVFEIFPGIDRSDVFSVTNLRELIVELALGLPALLAVRRRRRGKGGEPACASPPGGRGPA